MVLIIADNQDITRLGITYLSNSLGRFSEVKEAKTRKELVNLLTECTDAAVVLDYTLFDVSTDYLLILCQRFRYAHWLLFSENLNEDFIRRVVFSGNSFSLVLKDSSLKEIKQALLDASFHKQYICNSFMNWENEDQIKKAKNSASHSLLTVTEKEILKAMALGKSTKEIAAERFSSIHTIMTHRKNIFRKLGVNNVHEATKYALRAGILNAVEYYI